MKYNAFELNIGLKHLCPHCKHEHITVGISEDNLVHFLCPLCRGWCELFEMTYNELLSWIEQFYSKKGVLS